mgnify:CR=1 FL=1
MSARPLRVLMVCLGNICRSPTAEAVLRERLRTRGLHGQVEVDSADRQRAVGELLGDVVDAQERPARSRRVRVPIGGQCEAHAPMPLLMNSRL